MELVQGNQVQVNFSYNMELHLATYINEVYNVILFSGRALFR